MLSETQRSQTKRIKEYTSGKVKKKNSWGKMVHFSSMKSITALNMNSLNIQIKKIEFVRLDKKSKIPLSAIYKNTLYIQTNMFKKKIEKGLSHKHQPKES